MSPSLSVGVFMDHQLGDLSVIIQGLIFGLLKLLRKMINISDFCVDFNYRTSVLV